MIDINQKKISIGAEYTIYLNGNHRYSATKKLFSFLDKISLFDNTGSRPFYQMNKKWSWFKLSYDIIRYDKNVAELRTESFWKRHYKCQAGEDLYEIFGHKGRKYSIYKNAEQVAWWDKEAVSWFSGDNYKIIANNNVEAELLICFCLIIDNTDSENKDGNTVSYDFGNIGPVAKKFNPNWQPIN